MKAFTFSVFLPALCCAFIIQTLHAQSTVFTYQGSLTENGQPASGTHDFEFRLFDSNQDGLQIGSVVPQENIQVTAGLFTVSLDFGAVFDGSNRYLEISVRPGSSTGGFSVLSPRQPITATPYAVKALEAHAVPAGTITSDMLASASVTADKISAPGSEQIPVSDGNGGIVWMTAGDYLLSQNYNPPLPGIVENEAFLEISGIFDDVVQVVNGPGVEIERIPSTYTESGLNAEYALVFDYDGDEAGSLQTWFDELQSGSGDLRSGSLIVEQSDGSESFRWNFLEYQLIDINAGGGTSGKNRYTLTHALNPNRLLGIDLTSDWLAQVDDNQGADNMVEITGVTAGVYPVVQDNPSDKTLTMTFDYSEAAGIWDWVEQIATDGTSIHGRKDVSVIFQRNDGLEIGRNNYFECFPVRYQHFTGFGQDSKSKARLVLSYDASLNAEGGSSLYSPPVVEYFPGTANLEVPADANDNVVVMELSGVFANLSNDPRSEKPVILSGPGVQIERIPGFDGLGNPDDQSGSNREFPLIFEIGSPHLAALELWRDTYHQVLPTGQQSEHKSGSINILNASGTETFRWNLLELIPYSIERVSLNRSRVTLYHAFAPDNSLAFSYDGNPWGTKLQDNRILDTEVEISGLNTVFAETEVNTAKRTITLVYDFGEGGFLFDWVKAIAENGTTTEGKRAVSVKSRDPVDYLGCFPIRFQHFTGFEQDLKGRQLVVISYDTARPVLP